MLYVYIGIASIRQIQCVSTTYVAENKETYFEIYKSRNVNISSAPLKRLNLPISYKIYVTICQIVYINMTVVSPNLIS